MYKRKNVLILLLVFMLMSIMQSFSAEAVITDGYWRLEKIQVTEHIYQSDDIQTNIVRRSDFDKAIVSELDPDFKLGQVSIISTTYVPQENGIEGTYRSYLKFTHAPTVLHPEQKFHMEFYGNQLHNTTDLMLGMVIQCSHQLLSPEGKYQPPMALVEGAGISLMTKERGEKGQMQFNTAQISPRIPDAKREYGYIFRVEVKNGKAYRQYDHIYRWQTGPYPGAEEINVYINNELLVADVPPAIINNRTMLPVRAILEACGADVGWNGATQTITATKGDTTIVMVIGSSEAYVNGTLVLIDAPPVVTNNRTLVPARFLAESLNAKVGWDGNNKTVDILFSD